MTFLFQDTEPTTLSEDLFRMYLIACVIAAVAIGILKKKK